MQTSHNRLLSWTADPIGGELEYSESIDWTDVGTIPFLELWGRKSEGDAFTTLAPANGSAQVPQLSEQSNAEAVSGLPAQTHNEHRPAWEPPYSINDDISHGTPDVRESASTESQDFGLPELTYSQRLAIMTHDPVHDMSQHSERTVGTTYTEAGPSDSEISFGDVALAASATIAGGVVGLAGGLLGAVLMALNV